MNQKAEVSNIAGHYLLGHIPLIGKNENWFPLIEFRGANGKKNGVWFSVRIFGKALACEFKGNKSQIQKLIRKVQVNVSMEVWLKSKEQQYC